MKRITEAQIRQVIREEILELLKEIATTNKTFVGELTVKQLINVLSQIDAPYTKNVFNFIELAYDKRNANLMNEMVKVYRTNQNDYVGKYHNGENYVELNLNPSQATGKGGSNFPNVAKDMIVRKINQVYNNKLQLDTFVPEQEFSLHNRFMESKHKH